jgi:hypothetical protein
MGGSDISDRTRGARLWSPMGLPDQGQTCLCGWICPTWTCVKSLEPDAEPDMSKDMTTPRLWNPIGSRTNPMGRICSTWDLCHDCGTQWTFSSMALLCLSLLYGVPMKYKISSCPLYSIFLFFFPF